MGGCRIPHVVAIKKRVRGEMESKCNEEEEGEDVFNS